MNHKTFLRRAGTMRLLQCWKTHVVWLASLVLMLLGLAACDSSDSVGPTDDEFDDQEESFSLVVRSSATTLEIVSDTGGTPELLVDVGSDNLVRDHFVSPDGEYVAYIKTPNSDEGESTLHVRQIDGTSSAQITGMEGTLNMHGNNISWSPESDRLVIGMAWGHMYVVNRDGSDLRQLVHDPVFGRNPHWARSADWITFTGADTTATGSDGIWVVRPDGSNARKIADASSHLHLAPRISPDGRWVAFEADREIHLVRRDGSERRPLTPNPSEHDWRPRWDPSGSRIAYQADRGTRWMIEVRAVSNGEITGSIDYDPTRNRGVIYPSWSPDGQQLAFTLARLDSQRFFSGVGPLAVADSREFSTWVEEPMPNEIGIGLYPGWIPDQ